MLMFNELMIKDVLVLLCMFNDVGLNFRMSYCVDDAGV